MKGSNRGRNDKKIGKANESRIEDSLERSLTIMMVPSGKKKKGRLTTKESQEFQMNDDVWGGSMEMKEDVIVDRSRAGLKREVEAASNDTEFGSQKELNLLQKES